MKRAREIGYLQFEEVTCVIYLKPEKACALKSKECICSRRDAWDARIGGARGGNGGPGTTLPLDFLYVIF